MCTTLVPAYAIHVGVEVFEAISHVISIDAINDDVGGLTGRVKRADRSTDIIIVFSAPTAGSDFDWMIAEGETEFFENSNKLCVNSVKTTSALASEL